MAVAVNTDLIALLSELHNGKRCINAVVHAINKCTRDIGTERSTEHRHGCYRNVVARLIDSGVCRRQLSGYKGRQSFIQVVFRTAGRVLSDCRWRDGKRCYKAKRRD